VTKRDAEIVDCICPCCKRPHQGRDCRPDSFCRNCKTRAGNDYSDGEGLEPRVNLVIRERKPKGHYKKRVDLIETGNTMKT
jgi:hypothetical protein